MGDVALAVDPEFRALIPPLTPEERAGLESNILKNGCRVPLDVWFQNGNATLVDGHNRHEICTQRGIAFETKPIEFLDRDAAMLWILDNQLDRRNLTLFVRAELALKYKGIIAKQAKENQLSGLKKGNSPPVLENSPKREPIDTRAEVAKKAAVSDNTIARVEYISQKADDATKDKLRRGDMSINQAHTEIKRGERKEENIRKEKKAAESIPRERLWLITPDQDVIPCHALITDPPYGILDEQWEPRDLETFTRTWATRWDACGADIVLVFWSQEHFWNGRVWLDESFSGYEFQQLLVWHYPNNKSPQSRKGFKQTWEPIFLYRLTGSSRQLRVGGANWGGDLHDFDCHVAAVPQSNFNGTELKQHPAQKPVSVMRWLINATTEPGELVCDPFAGSGTTGIAACQWGRRFHGIESDPSYREIAERRIATYGISRPQNEQDRP